MLKEEKEEISAREKTLQKLSIAELTGVLGERTNYFYFKFLHLPVGARLVLHKISNF